MEERDIVIIGAGPAALSAAIFTKLDGWTTLVLESSWTGGQGAIASTVSNYPGFPPGDGRVLMDNMEKQVTSAPPAGVGAELRHEKVLSIDAVNLICNTDGNNYKAKAIILATGSRMQRLGIPGEEQFEGKGVSYYAKLDMEKFAGKNVLVVGGGNTTAKSALVAKTVANDVTLIHRRESLRAYAAMVGRLKKEGVQVVYNTELKEIRGSDKAETAVLLDNQTGSQREIAIDWVVICVGTEPDTKLAGEAGIELAGGYIKVDEQLMTNKPRVFACGEITGCDRHLVSSAAQGAAAGMAVSEYLAMDIVKSGVMFEGAKNGKYADEYLAMIGDKENK
jgi:thioredoxin reductase (NADPH)